MPSRAKKNKRQNLPANKDNGNGKVDPRRQRLVELLGEGMAFQEAGIKAGFAKSYVNSGHFYRMLRSDNFLQLVNAQADKTVDLRRAIARLRLAKHSKLESKFLDECESDIELYAKYPKVAERDYKISGLMQEPGTTMQFIKVDQLIQTQNILAEQQNKPQDVVVIDSDKDRPNEDSE